MYILGDIGNSETKIYLVNSNKKIIKRINIPSKNINFNTLKKKLNKLTNNFKGINKSKNEIDLSLEQMRAMDSNIPIGVTYVPEVPISVDTKEDLINIETNIREHNDKS